jgi:hypothetical protein
MTTSNIGKEYGSRLRSGNASLWIALRELLRQVAPGTYQPALKHDLKIGPCPQPSFFFNLHILRSVYYGGRPVFTTVV